MEHKLQYNPRTNLWKVLRMNNARTDWTWTGLETDNFKQVLAWLKRERLFGINN